jgi:T-complex protein 1 subunit epsilon
MSLIFDEYGRPFIILREQQQKARIKGILAILSILILLLLLTIIIIFL